MRAKEDEMTDQEENRTKALSLGEALPLEIARVRDVIMPPYLAIGVAGRAALALMRAELDKASRAMISGDVVEMARAYHSLTQFTV